MSKHDEDLLHHDQVGPGRGSPTPRRVNVAVNVAMLAAIDRIIEQEDVTLTEAVRRLVTYGDFVYGAAKVGGSTFVVRDPEGAEREVILV